MQKIVKKIFNSSLVLILCCDIISIKVKDISMLNHKYAFAVIFGMCLVVSNAVAAPTVKRLGAQSSYSSNTTVLPSKATGNSNVSRAASVRSNVNTGKTATITKVKPQNDSNNATTSRLTVGKYIHNKGVASGLIRPNGSGTPSGQSDEITNLTDRVIQLENKVETKQEQLYAGDGIIIENNTISVDPSVQELPGRIADIEDELDEKVDIDNLSNNYYTKSEVDDAIEDQVIQANDTVYDAATGERTYVSIVDTFNKGILN